MPSRLLSTFWKKDHSSSLLKKVRKYLSSSPRWHLRQKIHWSIFWIKNVQNFFTHLMREFEKKKSYIPIWTTTGPIKLYIILQKTFRVTLLFPVGNFVKGKIAPENFSVKLLCIFVGFFVFIKIDPALCAKSRAKRLFSMRKKGSPREPSNLINSRRDIGFAPSKLCP